MPAYPTYPGPYADQDDLVGYWRGLSDGELDRADVLLQAAADLINELPNPTSLINSATHWVSLDAVKRTMIGGGGVKTLDQSMVGMSASQTFANPMGNLYITDGEINRLRGRSASAAASITLTSSVRIPQDPWNFQPPPLSFSRVQWVRLVPDTVALNVGAEIHLMVLAATFYDYEIRTDYAIYTTSDPTVATVDNDAVVTAVGVGTATITANYEGLSDTSVITVT